MEQRFPIPGGVLLCRENGGQAELRMELKDPGRGLYRGRVFGPGGEMDLGTMLPEGGGLRLCRSFSVETLRERGCWPIAGGRADMTYAFCQPDCRRETGESWFPHDPVLAALAGAEAGRLRRRETETGFLLSAPWDPRRPFPLAPLFCFARVEPKGGGFRVVLSFQTDGRPVFP